MSTVIFAIPGDINLPTGGYTYDRHVLALLPQFGVTARHLELPAGYPAPTIADLDATARAFADLRQGAVLMVDGLAYGAMPADVIKQVPGPIIALVHHPLCLETGRLYARTADASRPRWMLERDLQDQCRKENAAIDLVTAWGRRPSWQDLTTTPKEDGGEHLFGELALKLWRPVLEREQE